MCAFIKCIVRQDYSGLTKFGTPSQVELEAAWETIFQEYLALSGDSQISTLLVLLKSIAVLSNKLALIELIVEQLAIKHDPNLANNLRSLGFRFQYENGPELMRELELTIVQSKALLLQLQQDQYELEQLRKTEGGSATEQDYEQQFSAIEEFKGCTINAETYTVARYCADVRRMKERYSKIQTA